MYMSQQVKLLFVQKIQNPVASSKRQVEFAIQRLDEGYPKECSLLVHYSPSSLEYTVKLIQEIFVNFDIRYEIKPNAFTFNIKEKTA